MNFSPEKGSFGVVEESRFSDLNRALKDKDCELASEKTIRNIGSKQVKGKAKTLIKWLRNPR